MNNEKALEHFQKEKEKLIEDIKQIIKEHKIIHGDLYPEEAKDLRFLEILHAHDVEDWEGYKEAEEAEALELKLKKK